MHKSYHDTKWKLFLFYPAHKQSHNASRIFNLFTLTFKSKFHSKCFFLKKMPLTPVCPSAAGAAPPYHFGLLFLGTETEYEPWGCWSSSRRWRPCAGSAGAHGQELRQLIMLLTINNQQSSVQGQQKKKAHTKHPCSCPGLPVLDLDWLPPWWAHPVGQIGARCYRCLPAAEGANGAKGEAECGRSLFWLGRTLVIPRRELVTAVRGELDDVNGWREEWIRQNWETHKVDLVHEKKTFMLTLI